MKKFKAYSLLEITIYIGIVGILMLFASKSVILFKQAKIQKTITQINSIQIAYQCQINNEDLNAMIKKGYLTKEDITPSIGGYFEMKFETEDKFLILRKSLSHDEIEMFKSKLNEDNIKILQNSNLQYKI